MSGIRSGAVTFKGNPVDLEGPALKAGDTAPDFRVVDQGLQEVTLKSSAGKVRIISVVPSLDTPVCDQQTRKFNEAAAGLGDKVKVLTVSLDLPFAQKRFCATAGIEGVQVLSDYQDRSFGKAYGVFLTGLKLLARAVFVVNASDKIVHAEYVKEVTDHPDYEAALAAARSA